jgi:hypothetical protein
MRVALVDVWDGLVFAVRHPVKTLRGLRDLILEGF